MQLIDSTSRQPVAIGDTVYSFRGNKETVRGIEPPRHSGSSGHVVTDAGRYYASVYNLEYITETPAAPGYFGRKCFRVGN